MGQPLSEHFQRLFEYECASHAQVLDALQGVPEERRSAHEFQRALDLCAHVAAARRLWLARLGVAPPSPDGLEPKGVVLAELKGRFEELNRLWTGYLAGLDDAQVSRAFEYQSLDAGRFRNTVGEVLTQLHGHSLYHRGQNALLLKALGCAPPITDFIFWARVSVGA